LAEKVRLRLRAVAALGPGTFGVGFGQAQATVGELAGGLVGARLWLFRHSSGLQSHYQLDQLSSSCAP
jgi:hypothetical protein